MKRDERRAWIAEQLSLSGRVQVDESAELLGVSKMTIHRDLDAMAEEGLVRKMRGGATIESSALFESDYRFRAHHLNSEKSEVAQLAASRVEPGMTVMINDGSTGVAIAEALLQHIPLTIITNNMGIYDRLSDKGGVDLILTGGNYLQKYHALHGVAAETTISRLRADISLISTAAVDLGSTFSRDQNVVRVKQMMIKSSAKSYLTVTKNKFRSSALYYVAALQDFDAVITNPGLPEEISVELKDASIPVLNALPNAETSDGSTKQQSEIVGAGEA